MKPVDQTTFRPETGHPDTGDCFRAAMASMLDLPLDAVPHIFAEHSDPEAAREHLDRWLGEHGLAYIEVSWSGDSETPVDFPVPTLAHGRSPRGEWDHTVIVQNGTVVHDPHPSRQGLRTFEQYGWFLPMSFGAMLTAVDANRRVRQWAEDGAALKARDDYTRARRKAAQHVLGLVDPSPSRVEIHLDSNDDTPPGPTLAATAAAHAHRTEVE